MARWEEMSPPEVLSFFQEFGRTVRKGELGIHRHHYALGLAQATRMAIHCGVPRISAVELGVFRGEGLLELCKAADYLRERIGIEFAVYGFDTGSGLPVLEGYMDHPELWHSHAFPMPDPAELRAKLPPYAKLILGDVGETLPPFTAELASAPLGFVSFDVDLYSSTKRATNILRFAPELYLPGVALLFDDTHTVLTHSDWCGEAAAVRDFNYESALRKIDRKPTFQINKFAVGQIFDHPIRQGTAKSRWPLTLGYF